MTLHSKLGHGPNKLLDIIYTMGMFDSRRVLVAGGEVKRMISGNSNALLNTLRPMRPENEELKTAGLKVTLPRVKILRILEDSAKGARHLSAEDVYKKLLEAGDDVGLATVYRVLTQFETAGLVDRHNFETGHSVFELSKGAHHDHMVCIDTGEIIEFSDDSIEEKQRQIAEQHGYELEDHSLVLYVRKKQ